MTTQLPILAVLWPLISGVICSLLPAKGRTVATWATIQLAAGVGVSWSLLQIALSNGAPISYRLSGWAPPLGIELKVTVFSAFLSLLISAVALLAFLGGQTTWDEQIGGRRAQFMALFLLLVAAFQGLCLSNDAFNLYVMLEISSLATYGLIALGGGRAYLATFHYIVMGTIGASFYLIGVGYLYIKLGSLNISDLATRVAAQAESVTVVIGLAFIVVGLLLKMAVFPLHAWLPNAYTYAPDATTLLVAPLSTKLAVFLLFRVLYDIFGAVVLPQWSLCVVWLASVGIVCGSALALAQRDLKKIFACLIVAEAGYMLGGIWVADLRATVGALFHLVNDSVATLALFLVALAAQAANGGRNLTEARGMFKRSPLTSVALVVVAFNLIGVPPSAGFFSKFTLITGAIASGRYEFVVALLTASLCNLAIFFRIIETAYFHPESEDANQANPHSSHTFLGALALGTSLFLFVLGLYSETIMAAFIRPVVGG